MPGETGLPVNLRPLIHSPLLFGIGPGNALSRFSWFSEGDGGRGGFAIDIAKASGLAFPWQDDARLCRRAAISAASMGIAYLGFERVSAGVTSYRNSVSEADLARNIDRELISYQGLARYYVVTGKEDDAKAALAAETHLKDAIDQSMKGTTDPARLDQITRLGQRIPCLHQDFCRYPQGQARQRADDAKSADAWRQHAALQARRSCQQGRRSASFRRSSSAPRRWPTQFQAVIALANTFVINSDQTVAASAMARLKFVENSLQTISSKDEKIVQGLKEARACSTTTGRRSAS